MENKAFRYVRQATGLAQPAFADLVGVSESTVVSVDCGRLAVGWELAQKIAAKTGALALDLMTSEPAIEFPRAWHGGKFETTDFHAWRTGEGMLVNPDRFADCVIDFLAAVPAERRAEVQARFAQLMARPEFEAIANEASRAQRAAGKFDFEDLRGFTARVNQ